MDFQISCRIDCGAFISSVQSTFAVSPRREEISLRSYKPLQAGLLGKYEKFSIFSDLRRFPAVELTAKMQQKHSVCSSCVSLCDCPTSQLHFPAHDHYEACPKISINTKSTKGKVNTVKDFRKKLN